MFGWVRWPHKVKTTLGSFEKRQSMSNWNLNAMFVLILICVHVCISGWPPAVILMCFHWTLLHPRTQTQSSSSSSGLMSLMSVCLALIPASKCALTCSFIHQSPVGQPPLPPAFPPLFGWPSLFLSDPFLSPPSLISSAWVSIALSLSLLRGCLGLRLSREEWWWFVCLFSSSLQPLPSLCS